MRRLIEIREGVVNALKNADIPRIGDNVFEDRDLNYFPDNLPGISVYTRRSPCDDEDTSPTVYLFKTELFVESVVQGEWYDDDGVCRSESWQLNVLSQYIIDALITDWDVVEGPFDGAVDDILLRGIFTGSSAEAKKTIKGEVVKFELIWREALPNAEPQYSFNRAGISMVTNDGENLTEGTTPDFAEDFTTTDVVEFDGD